MPVIMLWYCWRLGDRPPSVSPRFLTQQLKDSEVSDMGSEKFDKLNDSGNYDMWAYRMEMLLEKMDLWELVDGSAEPPAAAPWTAAMKKWEKRKSEDLSVVILSEIWTCGVVAAGKCSDWLHPGDHVVWPAIGKEQYYTPGAGIWCHGARPEP
ncbi:hypothetical protein FB451DRAFT_1172173 [Mycena latifolia]|nr:hypothetical protein FB451DRAFT_1172173 [Mycena latifolia]